MTTAGMIRAVMEACRRERISRCRFARLTDLYSCNLTKLRQGKLNAVHSDTLDRFLRAVGFEWTEEQVEEFVLRLVLQGRDKR